VSIMEQEGQTIMDNARVMMIDRLEKELVVPPIAVMPRGIYLSLEECKFKHLLDEEGRVVWRRSNTVAYRCCGKRRSGKIVRLLCGSSTSIIKSTMYPIASVVIILGVLKLVPMGVFIASVTYVLSFSLIAFMCLSDIRITRYLYTTMRSLTTVVLLVLAGVCVGILCEWDYRGVGVLVFYINEATSILTDTCPEKMRASIPVNSLVNGLIDITFLCLLNTGRFPDLDYTALVFTIPIPDSPGVPITALGVYNQAVVAQIILFLNIAYAYRGLHLCGATIALRGVNEKH